MLAANGCTLAISPHPEQGWSRPESRSLRSGDRFAQKRVHSLVLRPSAAFAQNRRLHRIGPGQPGQSTLPSRPHGGAESLVASFVVTPNAPGLVCSRLVPGRPPAASRCRRKVRAPKGKVAGNARRPRGQGQCHRDQTAGLLATATARVKRRGKSSPHPGRPGWHGKPHLEEDRIGGSRCPRPDPRVGRWRASARTLLEKWPPPPSGGQQNPAYGDQASHSRVTAPRRAQPNFGVCARMRRALLPARRSSSRTTRRSLGSPGPAAR